MPGVSFGNGKLGKSAVDIDTGTTGADKKFRRLKLPGGKPVIFETNKDSCSDNMPPGAVFTSDWGQTGVYAEKDAALQVVANEAPFMEHEFVQNKDKGSNLKSPAKIKLTNSGPAGAIGRGARSKGERNLPIAVVATRPATASVAVALPSPNSAPRVYPGYREWRPPSQIERKHLSLSRDCTPAGIPMGDLPRSGPPPKHIQSMLNVIHSETGHLPVSQKYSRSVSSSNLYNQDSLGARGGGAGGDEQNFDAFLA